MKKTNKKNLLIIAISCILIAALIFYYNNIKIPKVMKKVERDIRSKIDEQYMAKVNVAFVKEGKEISKYTVLTDEVIKENIQIKEIPLNYKVPNAVEDIDLIKGKITKEVFREGEQIVLASLSNEAKWFGEFDRLKEFKIDSLVGKQLKEGNIIDINVDYGNGDYDVVVPKVKVRKIAKIDDEETNDDENIKSNEIVIAVNEEEYRDLTLAKQLGTFTARIYLDESQRISPKTFDYEKAKKKLKLENINIKGAEKTKDLKESLNKKQKVKEGQIKLQN